jgi:hypothetical protein
MIAMRRRLSTLAMLWVLFQIAGTSAPLTLLAAGGSIEEICTCPSADHGATCPMHHPQGSERESSEDRCKLQNACAPADAALLSLAGGGGLPSSAVTCAPSTESIAGAATPATRSLSRALRPDSPPPRA